MLTFQALDLCQSEGLMVKMSAFVHESLYGGQIAFVFNAVADKLLRTSFVPTRVFVHVV